MGSPIIQIEARDADTGLNGDVHYRLKQDLAGHWRSFRIDEKSGIITLKLPLDRETQKLYEVHAKSRITQTRNKKKINLKTFSIKFDELINFYSLIEGIKKARN